MSEEQVQATEPTPVTVVEETKPSIDDTMNAVFDKMNPDKRVDRAPTGEFKSKTPVEAAEGAESSDTAPETPQEPTSETVKPEETPAIDMPASWASDRKEVWETLSPAARQFIAERETQAQTKISELGRAAKAIEPLKNQLEPLQRIAAQRGLQPGDALQRLLAADEFLSRDPRGAIQWLANAYRLDLSQFAAPQLNAADPESAHINALTQEIQQLKMQLGETTNRITSREQAETQARENTLAQTVEKFAEGKDYWPDIENEILAQIHAIKLVDPERVQSDPAKVLQEAHDRAVKLTPTVQEKLSKVAKVDPEAKAKAEAKKKADEAKRLASLNVKSSTGTTPKATSKDIYSEMADVYDRISATG